VYEKAACFSLDKKGTKNLYLGQNEYSKSGVRIVGVFCGTKIQGI